MQGKLQNVSEEKGRVFAVHGNCSMVPDSCFLQGTEPEGGTEDAGRDVLLWVVPALLWIVRHVDRLVWARPFG